MTQDSPDSTPVTRALAALGIPHRLFRHAGPVRSLEQAARARGQRPDQIVRSILFRIKRDQYVMVLMAGPRQISWRALRRHLGKSRVTMADKEEVLARTGYELGAVSPFGLPEPLRVLVDRGIYEQTGEVSLGAGERGATVILEAEDLRRALGDVEVGEFGKAPESS
jgi:Cys-tRNA(Pro) deacylase